MGLRAELFACILFSMDCQRHRERYPQRTQAFFATKVKQGHFGQDLKSDLGVHGVFAQLQPTGLRLPSRVSSVLKRQNNRRDVTSTNLAHTAPYCLHTSSKTMAEQYHKKLLNNSTLVPPPFSYFIRSPASELSRRHGLAIFPFLYFRKTTKRALIRARNPQRRPASVCYLPPYLQYQPGFGPFAVPCLPGRRPNPI